MRIFLIIFTFLLALCLCKTVKSTRVVCYYGSWANYRNGNGNFITEDIDPHLCTHVIYTFLGIETDGTLKILDSWLEIDLKNLERFNNLKLQNPRLKTLIAVGGWNEGSIKYSQLAANSVNRKNLINSAVALLQKYGFDGFDIDWEYPAQRGGSLSDKENYSTLLKEFREEFNKHGYLLTAAVSAAAFSVDTSYQVPALSKYLDSINVMTYDLHGAYDGVTGANAPLYPSAVDLTPNAKALTVEACIKGWISRGADPQKISMGMPIYGRTFTLSNPNLNSVGSPASNGGLGGPYTQESGMLGYLEICESLKKGGWTKVWDDNTKTPYAYKGNQWIGYDDERSIKLKVEFAKSLNLGGVMLWSLETEDAKGLCGRRYPILNTVKEVLNEQTSDDTVTSIPQTSPLPTTKLLPSPTPYYPSDYTDSEESDESNEETRTSPSSTPYDPSSDSEESNESEENLITCKEAGIFRHPRDCSVFYYCVSNGVKLVPLTMSCGNDLVFDTSINACNYKSFVKC